MVTANGNYVTKHSFGVYSTTPFQGGWRRESPAVLQAELAAVPKAPLVESACGAATVESYTVMHGKAGPEFSVVIGRLKETGQRFLANTGSEPAVLRDLQDRESLGRAGEVRNENGCNVFDPE
jgi:acetyl-CoA C-acetyltransferase